MEPYLIAVIAVSAVLIVLLLLAVLTDVLFFGRRCDKNPLLKYFTAEDFNLSAQPVCLPKGLKGFVYRSDETEDNGKLIVFCHGMGPGHIAYTTEIAYFCKSGFTVLAVDSRGCNFSEGKSLRGMYEGVKTAVSAVDYARTISDKVYLVGHSWGAYSALCASAKRKVEGVVAISAPDTPSRAMREGASKFIPRPFSAVLSIFWTLTCFFKYGVNGNASSAQSAKKNGTPTLIIHGDKDGIVSVKTSAYGKAEGGHITKILVKNRAHNPYNTENAEKLLAELSSRMRSGEKDFGNFDFTSATEEDKEVMQSIAEFIEKN